MNEQKYLKLTLLIPALLLTACATKTPVSVAVCPALPTKPSVSTQTPQVSYSTNAQNDINQWRESLTKSIMTVGNRSEEHTYELQSLIRHSYAVYCLQKQ